MKHLEDYFKGIDDLKLYFQVWSPDENPKAIVQIIHGVSEYSGRYLNIVNQLVPKGYMIYASDLRGLGKSEGLKGYVKKFENYVEDQKIFHDLIREKEPNLPLFLFGHSLGALVAILFASKYSEDLKGLILSGSGTKAGPTKSIFIRGLVKFLSKIAPKSKKATNISKLVSRNPEVVKAYNEDPLVLKKVTFKLIAELIDAYKVTTKLINKIKLPTLFISGSDDQLVLGAKELAELMTTPDKTVKIYEGLLHECHNEIEENRKIVLKDLADWLDAHS